MLIGSSSEEEKNKERKEENLNSENEAPRGLREIEMEVLAEGREWMRQRLEERLQQEAERQGSVFPPKRTKGKASAKKANEPAHRRRRG